MPALAPPITTHELVRFLLARFDEDERRVKRLAREPAADGGVPVARQRAEVLAHRRIVGSMQQLLVLRDQPSEKPVRDAAIHVLRWLAAPYADHPGFRPEWKTSSRA